MIDQIKLKTGVILLAAGNSERLGRPKQLLKFEGKTLLERSISSILKSKIDELVIVLGGNADEIQSQVDLSSFSLLINHDYELGMASSMKLGLSYLIDNYAIDQVLIILCDQPFVNEKLINQFFAVKEKGIVACTYGNTIGVPALFDSKYFEELLSLENNEGAKKIILKHLHDCDLIKFDLGSIDIDTEEDYQNLLKGDS
ncbi:molybdenum cofactor cytidylyltransferase [Belliella buryatensis]|uniref:Molybdenum cofactor cytidylyltransferase n=1 Tax=Belliella buryatensis TaxID=1500549 RepID=A0A239EVW6_9BACT|nr:nucleotidyltransferase family protein [Belliella buryatensis]SNS48816.1 molybdenum cofactor cytidylyltransferase [Belliella buryatensis]